MNGHPIQACGFSRNAAANFRLNRIFVMKNKLLARKSPGPV